MSKSREQKRGRGKPIKTSNCTQEVRPSKEND